MQKLLTATFVLCLAAYAAGQTVPPLQARHARPHVTVLSRDTRAPMRPSTSGVPGYSPQVIRTAYGLPSTGGSGTICIVSPYHSPSALSDFNTFSSMFSLPMETSTVATSTSNAHFQVLYATGSAPATDAIWSLNNSAAVEWAHALGPDAKIVLVEAASNSTADLQQALTVAEGVTGCTEICIPWSTPEYEGTYDNLFAGQNMLFISAASDSVNLGGIGGGVPEYPSTSPYVISVGGTSLQVDASGNRLAETGWNQSGGGESDSEPRPYYQDPIASLVGGYRGTPDIALDADPSTGLSVFCGSSHGWTVMGGTTLSAAMAAGILSITNGAFPDTASALSALYNQSGTGAFFDVTAGTSGQLTCAPGWDFLTGLGSLNGPLSNPIYPGLLDITPVLVQGGTAAAGTLVLTDAVVYGSVAVSLLSDTPSVTVPDTLTIPAGQFSGTFNIATAGVDTETQATIYANANGVTIFQSFLIEPAALASLTLNPTQVVGGTKSNATVSLDGPAGPSGALCQLSSSATGIATVPASVKVLAGANSAGFLVSSNVGLSATASATISATFAGVTRQATITVSPGYTMSTLSLAAASVIGGVNSTGTVTISLAAPSGGKSVSLSSSLPAAASVPATVTVPAGASSANFTITTFAVASPKSVSITATLNGTSSSQTLTVQPPQLLSVTAPTRLNGGSGGTGTVTLGSAAPSGGLSVSLSSDQTCLTVPATCSIAGKTTGTFAISTTAVDSDTTAHISATFNGTTVRATVLVAAPTLSTFSLSATSVLGGVGAVGTVTISGPAGPSNVTVSMSSSAVTVAKIDAVAVVNPNGTSATAAVTSFPVGQTTTVTFTATYQSVSKTAVLEVRAAALTSLAVNPASVIGGTSANAVLTLEGPSGPSGAAITMSSDSPLAAQSPTQVTIPAGAKTLTVKITTSPVDATTTAIITATLNGVTKTDTLQVKAPSIKTVTLPATVTGGFTARLTCTLDGPAGPNGVTVSLTCNQPGVVAVPTTLAIAAGATNNFAILPTEGVDATISATVTGSVGISSAFDSVSVTPAYLNRAIITPASLVGGNGPSLTAALYGKAGPSGVTVSVTSSSPAVTAAPIPIPAGVSSATITLKTSGVAASTTVTLNETYGNTTLPATLTLLPASLLSLTSSLAPVASKGTVVLTLTLNGNSPPAGASFTLTSSNATLLPVPSTYLMGANLKTAGILVRAGTTTTTKTVTITATYAGVTKQVSVQVTP
jgi:hypothetical protein